MIPFMDNNNDNFFDSLNFSSDDDGSADRVQLRVLGLSYSQIQNGAYALILAEVDGPMRIPVVIGPAEAQAIAIRMEGMVTPRPMTHDLFTAMGHAFGIELTEVFIYRFADGVFYSELTFANDERTVRLDSRTSDAIAIAMRTGAPIYTTREILQETGFEMEIGSPDSDEDESSSDEDKSGTLKADSATTALRREPPLENFTIERLKEMLDKYIEQENYEQASLISEIIRRKEQQAGSDDTVDAAE